MNSSLLMQPFAAPAEGMISLPGSKSQTNRALLCAALSEGTSRLSGVLYADDTEAMLEAIVSFGAVVEEDRQNFEIEVTGIAGGKDNGAVAVHDEVAVECAVFDGAGSEKFGGRAEVGAKLVQ